ncbi:MAG: plasmid pRiA4b ORF-3 family protein [Thermotaleaceae bacterium]
MVVQTFAASAPGEELEKGMFSKGTNYDSIFSYLSILVHFFNYFGFCSYVPIAEVNKKVSKYDDSIKMVIPTEFGVNICKVLREQNIADWNISWLKVILMEDEKEIVPGIPYQSKLGFTSVFANESEQLKVEKYYKERKNAGFIPLYKFLQPIFPEGVLNKTVATVINKVTKGSYVFKVSLGRGIWRTIAISYKHTLEDLHNAVQEAFDFDNDHLYSFFIDAKRYSKHAYHSPMSDEGPFTDEVTIGELELYEGQKILYLFDYGDSWEFEVKLLKKKNDEIPPRKPKVIEIKGEAPRQYG